MRMCVRRIKTVIFLTALLSGACFSMRAQEVAIKTNVLYDIAATVNAGVEFGLAPKWTLDISGNYNGWTLSDICLVPQVLKCGLQRMAFPKK